MNIIIKHSALLVLAIVANGSLAHSAEEHMENAEEADCSAMERMKGMDMSEMDEDDPVMQAIKKKCMEQWHGSKEGDEEVKPGEGVNHNGKGGEGKRENEETVP